MFLFSIEPQAGTVVANNKVTRFNILTLQVQFLGNAFDQS